MGAPFPAGAPIAAMANPPTAELPVVKYPGGFLSCDPDRIHDYEYELRDAVKRLNNDPRIRAPDRKIMLAFTDHIKALGVSTGRQVKVCQYAPDCFTHDPYPVEEREEE